MNVAGGKLPIKTFFGNLDEGKYAESIIIKAEKTFSQIIRVGSV